MNMTYFPSDAPQETFFKDIIEDGYHIFSFGNLSIPDFYPNKFPDYPGAKLKDLTPGDVITIRVFFRIGTGELVRADGGYIDLEVEHIEMKNSVAWARILTVLPEGFALSTGESIEIYDDEILFVREKNVALKG